MRSLYINYTRGISFEILQLGSVMLPLYRSLDSSHIRASMAKKKKTRSGTEVVGMIGLSTALPPPPPKPEIDPKWVWPPFPETPPETTIVAYRDFEPKGIVVLLEDDAQELDGDGVPTVRLRVQHSIGGAKEKRKQKNKKSKGPLAEVTQEELAKMTWDKKWELGEEMRMSEHIDS